MSSRPMSSKPVTSKQVFSSEDAIRLRNSLPAMDFRNLQPSSKLQQSYCDYYGLNFGDSQHTVSHHIGTLTGGEFQLVCQYYQLPIEVQRGTIFMLHGYFDHVGLYGHLISHCLLSGYSVVTFDLPGHGLSSGVQASISSFGQYSAALLDCMELARAEVNFPWILIGQSTGAAVIVDALLEHQLAARFDIDKYILLAPLLRPRGWFRSNMLFQATRWFLHSTPRKFSKNSHDEEFLKFLQYNDALQSRILQKDWVIAMIDFQRRFARSRAGKQALHIIQGSADGTVDWQFNIKQIVAKFPTSKTYMVSDAGHHLVNESKPFRERVFSIIDEILAIESD